MSRSKSQRIAHPNIFQIALGTLKFIAFWIGVLIQVPIVFLLPHGRVSV